MRNIIWEQVALVTYKIFLILILYGHNEYTRKWHYATLDTSTLLVISVLVVYTLMIQDTGYALCSVAS